LVDRERHWACWDPESALIKLVRLCSVLKHLYENIVFTDKVDHSIVWGGKGENRVSLIKFLINVKVWKSCLMGNSIRDLKEFVKVTIKCKLISDTQRGLEKVSRKHFLSFLKSNFDAFGSKKSCFINNFTFLTRNIPKTAVFETEM